MNALPLTAPALARVIARTAGAPKVSATVLVALVSPLDDAVMV